MAKEKKEAPDKGVFTWGAFTAIMIIVVCAAVLVFIFRINLKNEPAKPANQNVINESMIQRGVIQDEEGNLIVVENTVEPTSETETTPETDDLLR